uniref:SH3 domain-containing protein n=1 Tax=Amphiprion percula TaxID=161767 RepID=A0A3P8TF86_AMPPE
MKSPLYSVSLGDVVVGEAGGSMDLGETWQRGCNAWGVRGLFPTSCVKEMNLSGRSRQLSERSAQAQASELPSYALGQARALMSLHAQLNEELDFREGDLIIITGLPEPGWFQGELEGRRGIFPEGFVELMGPLRSPQEPEDLALYEFRALEPGELDFDVGDRIRVVSTLEDGWLEGELRGRRGIFPYRFVKLEDDGRKTAEETDKSLTTSYSDTNVGSGASRDVSPVADLNQQSIISRHFSILDYSDESDIIRGSSHSPVSNLMQSNSFSLERRRTLRPPPPRPRVLRPAAPAPYKPARPAPRPPPRCPRQNTTPPTGNSLTSSPIFYSPDEPAANLLDQTSGGQAEFGDLAAAQEHEIQSQLEAEQELEREMELESQRQREEEERYQLLLRLQEVEHDMEAYAHTAEELRAMLEEEEEETARMQALENLEFCNYTLETLALEQQQLQGKTGGR